MGKGRRGGGHSRKPRTNWTNIVKENEAWETYYRELNLIPEEEWPAFKKACQADLPLTFRITGTGKHAKEVSKAIQENYIPELEGLDYDGETLDAPKPLPWYPENLAWQFKVSKQVIRKNKQFSKFQRFLVVETEVGNTSRQEAVSMIPPLLLDIEPHHTVIDLCAAPGSKTAQLIESLHKLDDETKMPVSGFVIANDSDYKRSHMLVHQVKRLNSPNLLVTNHDAQFFPKIRHNKSGEVLKFDRVLCDVPCAGDGTMRKNLTIWNDWSVGAGLGLHPTQLNILCRGIQMLKPGGRLVYSTCSLNPIENEAVVAEALRRYGDSVTLADCSDRLPGLVRSPGTSKWKVQTKDKVWHEKYEEGKGLVQSWFPPTEEEAAKFNLDRCIRVYHHQQDTGGFFIGVFEKKADLSETEEQPAAKRVKIDTTEQEQVVNGAEPDLKKDKLPRDANEEPFIFLSPENETLKICWKFYDVSDEFPKDTMLVRNATGDPVRTIYYVAPCLKPIISLNDSKLSFVYSGIRMFAQQKNEGECKWRVQSEGLDRIFPFLGSTRTVTASSTETLRDLCLETFPRFDRLEQMDASLKEQIVKLSEGCAFIKIPIPESISSEEDYWVYPLWKGKGSTNLMLSKEDVQELLHRVFKVEDFKGRQPSEKLVSLETTPLVEDSETASKAPSASEGMDKAGETEKRESEDKEAEETIAAKV